MFIGYFIMAKVLGKDIKKFYKDESIDYLTDHDEIELDIDEIDDLKDDEKYMQTLVSVTLDKYYTNEHLSYKSKTVLTRFSPSIFLALKSLTLTSSREISRISAISLQLRSRK